jgi:hypothetical protein
VQEVCPLNRSAGRGGCIVSFYAYGKPSAVGRRTTVAEGQSAGISRDSGPGDEHSCPGPVERSLVCLCGLNAPGLPSRVPSVLGKPFGSFSLRPGLTAWLRFLYRTASLRFPAVSTRVDRSYCRRLQLPSSCLSTRPRRCPRCVLPGAFPYSSACRTSSLEEGGRVCAAQDRTRPSGQDTHETSLQAALTTIPL